MANPREFTFSVETHPEYIHFELESMHDSGDVQDGETIHLIEYSDYQRLQAELEVVSSEYNRATKIVVNRNEQISQLEDALAAEKRKVEKAVEFLKYVPELAFRDSVEGWKRLDELLIELTPPNGDLKERK